MGWRQMRRVCGYASASASGVAPNPESAPCLAACLPNGPGAARRHLPTSLARRHSRAARNWFRAAGTSHLRARRKRISRSSVGSSCESAGYACSCALPPPLSAASLAASMERSWAREASWAAVHSCSLIVEMVDAPLVAVVDVPSVAAMEAEAGAAVEEVATHSSRSSGSVACVSTGASR